MADLFDLKRIYRRLAKENAGEELSDQLDWLKEAFGVRGGEANTGGFQASTMSTEGASFSGLFRGASSEDRALALLNAIEDIEAEIAAEEAGESVPLPTAVLIPRVVCAPR